MKGLWLIQDLCLMSPVKHWPVAMVGELMMGSDLVLSTGCLIFKEKQVGIQEYCHLLPIPMTFAAPPPGLIANAIFDFVCDSIKENL